MVTRLLTMLGLGVGSLVAQQAAPRRLSAVPIFFWSADSVELVAGSTILIDRAGHVLAEYVTTRTAHHLDAAVLEFTRDYRGVPSGPDGHDLAGLLGGWVGRRGFDSLWINTDSATEVLDRTRRVRRTVNAPGTLHVAGDSTVYHYWGVGATYPDGSFATGIESYDTAVRMFGIPRGSWGASVRIAADGRVMHVLPMPAAPRCVTRTRDSALIWIPYCTTPMSAMSPDGSHFVVAFPDSASTGFRVVSYDARGRVLFQVRIVAPVKPLRDAAMRMLRRLFDSALTVEARRTIPMPLHRREFSYVVADDDGSVWIGLDYGPADDGRWIELDRHGHVLGQLQLPWVVAIRTGSRDEIWALQSDQGNNPKALVGYRIVR